MQQYQDHKILLSPIFEYIENLHPPLERIDKIILFKDISKYRRIKESDVDEFLINQGFSVNEIKLSAKKVAHNITK